METSQCGHHRGGQYGTGFQPVCTRHILGSVLRTSENIMKYSYTAEREDHL